MRQCSCLTLIIVVLALVACAPPVDCGEKVVCKCMTKVFVEAWTDRDGNGSRDPEDEPLQGARFGLQWLDDPGMCMTPHMATTYMTTDATGHDLYQYGGCGCGTEKIEPETPAGYALTTSTAGECLFDAPATYLGSVPDTRYCRRYGFTPVAP
jgi:hypothetical protein